VTMSRIVERIEPVLDLRYYRVMCVEAMCQHRHSDKHLSREEAWAHGVLHAWDYRHAVNLVEVTERFPQPSEEVPRERRQARHPRSDPFSETG